MKSRAQARGGEAVRVQASKCHIMIVGVVKEIKAHEYRVGMIPAGVAAFVKDGHQVLAETSAGQGSGFSDEDYVRAGEDRQQPRGGLRTGRDDRQGEGTPGRSDRMAA